MDEPTPAWDGADLAELLGLAAPQPGRFRSRVGEINEHGRVYGGQLLGQALAAATSTVPADRPATAMQFMFLAGALPDRPIDYEVGALQDGKRFSARHVRGSQTGGRFVCDANVSFAAAIDSPDHMAPAAPDCGLGLDPETLPGLSEIAGPEVETIERTLGYMFRSHAAIDFRAPFVDDLLRPDPNQPRMRFWIRMRRRLPDDASLHAAAFAYLSDYWINFAGCIAEVRPIAEAGTELYVASLNHAIWFHRALRADDWLLFDCVSPTGAIGRGLSIGRVYNRAGRLVASATQECLLAPMGDWRAARSNPTGPA
ncbi:MAG TPA: acyl-CoA thioesterase domain-containing protein [Roseiarcus sp.]